jgi:uncharacterized protein (DUF58 family)
LWFLVLPPETQRTVPTVAGGVLVAVALGIGLAAYNNANNVLFIALSLLLSSLVLSGLLSWANFRGLRWRLALPARVRAGEPTPVSVEVMNQKRIIPSYSLVFRVRARRDGEGTTLFLTDRLDPGRHLGLEWLFHPRRRGVETVEIAGVESQFPFGFLNKTAGGSQRHDLLVWPARISYEFIPPTSQRANQAGETQRRPGPGADLLGLRPYRPGDAPRLVHWKASARLRELVVRQTGEEQRAGFYIVMETMRALWRDDAQFEKLCGFAGSLAEDLFTEGRLLGVSVNGEPLQPVKRLADLHRFLDQLARLTPVEHGTPIALAAANIITFKPGPRQNVHAYLGRQLAGEA